MPVGKFVSFGLFVDNVKLPEYVIKDKTYCDVDLHGPASFTIEDDAQRYPVLPFKITFRRLYEEVVWLRVFLDGQVICSTPLCRKTFTCEGVKVGNEIRELLFSLPRIMEDQERRNPLGQLAGTIRVEVYNVTPAPMRQVPMYERVPVYEDNSQGSKLQYLTKKDIQGFGGALFGGIVSREGRLTQKMIPTGHYRTVKGRQQGRSIMEELTLHYRPHARMAAPLTVPLPGTQPEGPGKGDGKPERAALNDIGNVTQQQTNPPAAVNPVPVKEEENKAATDAKKTNGDIKPSDGSAVNMEAATDAKKTNGDMKPSDGSAVNMEADPASKKIKLDVKLSDSSTVNVEASTASTKTDVDVKLSDGSAVNTEAGTDAKKGVKLSDDSAVVDLAKREVKRESCMKQDSFKSDPTPHQEMKRCKSEAIAIKEASSQDVIMLSDSPSTLGSSVEEFLLIDDSDDREEEDIIVCKEEDNSVICMGDDECCIFEVSNNISIIDLDDTICFEDH